MFGSTQLVCMSVKDASEIAEQKNQDLFLFLKLRDGKFTSIDFEAVTVDVGYAVKENRMKNGLHIRVKDEIQRAKVDSEWRDVNFCLSLETMSNYHNLEEMKQTLLRTKQGKEFIEFMLDKHSIKFTDKLQNSLPRLRDQDSIEPSTRKAYTTDIKTTVDIDIDVEEEKEKGYEDIIDEFKQKRPRSSSVVYCLKLLHKDRNERAFYVGETTRPMMRIVQHIRKDGDFSSSNGYILTGIHSVHPASKICERKKYVDMRNATDCPVFGGR